jgi:hypothetical protein
MEDRPVPWRQWSLIAAGAAGLLGVTDVVLSVGTDGQWAALAAAVARWMTRRRSGLVHR